jgi:hypothetical protein
LEGSHAESGAVSLATDVISFHYVSEIEAQLLFDLLNTIPAVNTSKASSTRQHLLPICRAAGNFVEGSPTRECSTSREIHALWPVTDQKAGHYSRPLSKGPASFHEAELLYDYLSRVTVG